MTIRRTEEDLLHPERVLFRLLQDYSSGILQNRPNSAYLRARVEDVDHEGGRLESLPPNPPNSVRARIYTAGMDFNLPSDILTVFYPLGNLRPAMIGEHVMVTFEDANQTSGYWIGTLPQRYDVNYTNPDDSQIRAGDTSHTFEGDSVQQRQPNPTLQYGGLVDGNTETQERIINVVETQTNHWSGKSVLHIGDSQCEGPPGITLGNFLRNHGVTTYIREGRTGWGVYSWISGRLHSTDTQSPSLQDLITEHNPDIVIITLGGNDGSSGAARRSDYEDRVRSLWTIARTAPIFAIWGGPPTAVGAAGARQPGRDIAAQKIRSVVGNDHFVDPRVLTNTSEGRRSDGVHFLTSSPVLEPWAELYFNTGNLL